MSQPERAPAIFLDRDGTLIEDMGYPRDPRHVHLLGGVVPALGRLQSAGYRLVMVSNQSGIGRGIVTPEEADRVHKEVVFQLLQQGIRLDAWYYCPHAPEVDCSCRKPLPGMILQAAAEHGLDLPRSWMIGDKESDVAAGQQAGCRTIFLKSDPARICERFTDARVDDWTPVAEIILSKNGPLA